MAERRAARENSTAEIRERKFREAVELDGAAREAGRALATEPGRGEGHGGAPAGSPGEALIDRSSLWGTVIHRAERIALRGSSTRGRASVFVVERLSSGGSRANRFSAFFAAPGSVATSHDGQSGSVEIVNRLNYARKRGRGISSDWG